MSSHDLRSATVVALAATALLGGCGGDDEDASEPSDVAVTATQPAATTATAPATTSTPAPTATATTATATTRKRSLADARKAVEQDNYAEAVGIAAAAGTDEASAIRRRISNRVARRIMSALRESDRKRAAFLVNSARRYPPTRQLREALRRYQEERTGAR